jgi:hypothetical protein
MKEALQIEEVGLILTSGLDVLLLLLPLLLLLGEQG